VQCDVKTQTFYTLTNMGGGPTYQNSQETTADMMKAWTQYMPELTRVTGENILPMELAQLQAQQQLAPQQAQLSYDLASQYLPQFTQLGVDQARQQAMGQAESDVALMAGPGRELAANTLAIQQILDPEFYKSRGQAGDALTSLFGSLDDPTTGLSGAEREEVTRTLARDNASRGNLDATQNSTVEAAMQMGSAGQARKSQKQAAIGQAVQAAAGAMPAFRTGVDALQLTTGRPSTPNVGLGQFGGVQQVGNNTMQLGSQLMQQTGTFAGNNQQNQATKKDTFDKFGQVAGGLGAMTSCCWTFREFTDKFPNGVPWYVRASRDAHYTPARREGYRLFSKHMVPLMQKSKVIRLIVDATFVDPLTKHAAWLAGVNKYGWVFEPLKVAWLGFFQLLGSRNGEPAEAYT
jgi:hypothetical protein